MEGWDAEQIRAWEKIKASAKRAGLSFSPGTEATLIASITKGQGEDWDTLAEIACEQAGITPSWEYLQGESILLLAP